MRGCVDGQAAASVPVSEDMEGLWGMQDQERQQQEERREGHSAEDGVQCYQWSDQ